MSGAGLQPESARATGLEPATSGVTDPSSPPRSPFARAETATGRHLDALFGACSGAPYSCVRARAALSELDRAKTVGVSLAQE